MVKPRGNRFQSQRQYQQGHQRQQDQDWQRDSQQDQYVSSNYKGKVLWNHGKNRAQNNSKNLDSTNNGAQNGPGKPREWYSNQQIKNGAPNNGSKTTNSSYDPEQVWMFDAWKKQQQELKRQQQIEAEALFLQNQKAVVEDRSEPPIEVVYAVKFLRILSKEQISEEDKEKARSAVDMLQSYMNQQIQQDKQSQENLSILVGWVLWFGHSGTALSDPEVVKTISKAIEFWEVRLGISPPSSAKEHSKPVKKEVEAKKSQLETNIHVSEVLDQFDYWLKQSGLTFARIEGDKVYYTYDAAATEEERKKEVRFVEIADNPSNVKLENNDNLTKNANLVRTAEHAFIVWALEQDASKKLALVKQENIKVFQAVARFHPEARKQYEAFETALEAKRALIKHEEMEAQLKFEKMQEASLAKLEEDLERQRREFFGIASPDIAEPKSHIPRLFTVAAPASKTSLVAKPDYGSYLFSGLKSPTIPVATKKSKAKKPMVDERRKKQLTYPQFQHTSAGVFRVDLYTGDPAPDKRGDGRITQDVNGTYVFIKPVPMPCIKGCQECWTLNGDEDVV